MALEHDAVQAVIALHDDLAAWMGRGDEKARERIEASLAPDFVQIAPSGVLRTRSEVVAGISGIGGSYGAGFKIAIDDATPRPFGDAIAVTYREVQSGSARAAPDRFATAILAYDSDGLIWRHLHETWCG